MYYVEVGLYLGSDARGAFKYNIKCVQYTTDISFKTHAILL